MISCLVSYLLNKNKNGYYSLSNKPPPWPLWSLKIPINVSKHHHTLLATIWSPFKSHWSPWELISYLYYKLRSLCSAVHAGPASPVAAVLALFWISCKNFSCYVNFSLQFSNLRRKNDGERRTRNQKTFYYC